MALFILLSIVYIAQTLLIEPDKSALIKYNISATETKILSLAIVLPYIVIWFVALVGSLRLRNYAATIRKGKDGAGFRLISLGIAFLAAWLPLSAVFTGFITQSYATKPDLIPIMTILSNYSNLLILAPGFVTAYLGSCKLVNLAKTKRRTPSNTLVLAYIAFSALYTLSVLSDPVKRVASGDVVAATYYQPDWLIVLTLVIPRLIVWFLGLMAVENIYLFRMNVKGSLYKIGLHWLALGLGAVIISSIVLRFYQSISSQISHLSLAMLLMVIYVLLAMISVGYILLAKGAKKLQFIENL